jgi:hypothetical protein
MTIGFVVTKYPPVLTVQIRRFAMDWTQEPARRMKLASKWLFPFRLNVAPFSEVTSSSITSRYHPYSLILV